MAGVSTEGSERKTDRLEGFTDAVLAVAITLPVVMLHAPSVPPGGDLLAAYAKLQPDYLAYALSFTVIGLYWAHAHFSGKIYEKTDHVFNVMTLAFLACVSLTPFPARPLVEHWGNQVSGRAAANVYAVILAAPSFVWFVRWLYSVRAELLDGHLAQHYLHGLTVKYGLTAAAFGSGAALTFVADWRLGVGVQWLCVLGYFLPPTTPEFKPGQAPKDELEEADERRD